MTDHVWGIDPAIGRIAFAFAPVGAGAIAVETLTVDSESREGQRLGWLDRQLRIRARQLASAFPPAVVWVEQPSGRHRNLPLTYAVGVIQAALFETLAVPVWTMPSSSWKRATVGAGNATKQQAAAWAASKGADVDGQDEVDAYCIAAAGRAMLNTGTWGAAA